MGNFGGSPWRRVAAPGVCLGESCESSTFIVHQGSLITLYGARFQGRWGFYAAATSTLRSMKTRRALSPTRNLRIDSTAEETSEGVRSDLRAHQSRLQRILRVGGQSSSLVRTKCWPYTNSEVTLGCICLLYSMATASSVARCLCF